MSIVRENLLTRKGYTPYCGAVDCCGRWPRTQFDGQQFECQSCGWRSQFETVFIAEYKAATLRRVLEQEGRERDGAEP